MLAAVAAFAIRSGATGAHGRLVARQSDFRAFLQAVGAFRDDLLPRFQASPDFHHVGGRLAPRDHAHGDGFIRFQHVDKVAVVTVAQGRHGHQHGARDVAQFQAHVDELAGEQRHLVIRVAGLGAHGARLHVDLVVQRRQAALVQGMRARAVQRQRGQGRAAIQALLDGLHFILRHGELDVDGRELRHHHHAARVAGADQIADIDHLQARAAADRRHHLGVAEVQPGRAFGRAVRHDGAFQLLDQGGLRVDVLARDGILAQQGLIAFQGQARVFQLRFVALALARGLHQRHLELGRVDLRHHLARLDHAAFLEFQFLQNARHLRAHRHGGRGRHCAQRVEHHGQVGFHGRGHAHGGRRAATAPARATWPARTAWATHAGAALGAGARMGQVPGTAPQRSHHGQRDDRTDDF
ncbi:hypothetical protein D3C72_1169750 [compost metagenome]